MEKASFRSRFSKSEKQKQDYKIESMHNKNKYYNEKNTLFNSNAFCFE